MKVFGTSIESEEVYQGLSVQRSYGGLLRRGLAYAVDVSIITVFLYIGMFVFMFFGFSSLVVMPQDLGAVAAVGMVLLFLLCFFALFHGYFIYFESQKGATPGKRIFGLSVVDANHLMPSVGQCVFRDLMRYIDCALMLPGILSIVLSSKNQRLGDMVAGTLVLHSAYQEQQSKFRYITQDEYLYFLELLTPGEVPEDVAKSYLSYAFKRFGKGKVLGSGLGDMEWLEVAKRYLPNASDKGLNDQSTLLFFAEHCHQSLHI